MANDSILLKLGADTAAFQKGINGAIKSLAGLAVAYVGVRAMTEAFGNALEMGDRLSDLSKRTGAAAGDLAVLERAFKNTGNEVEAVGPMFNRMQKALVQAGDPTSKQAQLIEALGLSLSELSQLSPDQQFQKIASSIGGIQDPAVAAAASMELFGKSGGALLPMFKNMAEETEAAKKQLGDLPDIMDRSAGSFDNINDALSAIGQKQTEVAVGILSELVPALEAVTGPLAEINAAGFGVKIGEQLGKALQGFAAWFADPGDSLAAFGFKLAAIMLETGNYLIAGYKWAGQWLENFFTAIKDTSISDLCKTLFDGFQYAGLALERTILGALMSFANQLANIPGMEKLSSDLVDAFGRAYDSATEIQMSLSGSGDKIAGAFTEANAKTKFIYDDVLGAGDALEKAAAAAQKAMEAGSAAIIKASDTITNNGTFGTMLTGDMPDWAKGPLGPEKTTDSKRVSSALNDQGKRDDKALGLEQALAIQEAQNTATSRPTRSKTKEVENLKWSKNYADALKSANEAGMEDPYGYANRVANSAATQPTGRTNVSPTKSRDDIDAYGGKTRKEWEGGGRRIGESVGQFNARKSSESSAAAEQNKKNQEAKGADKKVASLDSMVLEIKNLMFKLEQKLPTPALAP